MGRAQNLGPDVVRTGQVTVTTTATLIFGKNAQRFRADVVLLADGTDLYVGDSTVTTATGMLVAQGKGASYSTDTCDALYGVVASGTLAVSYSSSDYA